MTAEEFAAIEDGADPLVGDSDNTLIPEGGDVMVYGDGGAGRDDVVLDLACHLAAGDDWVGFPVPRPVEVLLIENKDRDRCSARS